MKQRRFGLLFLGAFLLLGATCAAQTAAPAGTPYCTVNLKRGTSAREAAAAVAYFRSFGLRVRLRHGILFAQGSRSQVAAAGHTTFRIVRVRGVAFEKASSRPAFSRDVQRHVLATTLGGGPPSVAAGMPVRPNFDVLPEYGFTPSGLAQFYDAQSLYGSGLSRSGENIAVEACGTYSQSDIAAFESWMGLPNNAPAVVPIDGSTQDINSDTTINLEYVIGAAPGANIYAYVTPFCSTGPSCTGATCNLQQGADTFAAIAADMPARNYVSVIGDYGDSEDFIALTSSGSLMSAIDADLSSIVSDGGTPFISSGIWGAGPPAGEALSAGEFTVFYPASDPNAIGVGGTAAIPQPSGFARQFELAWGFSGGGVSEDYGIPPFQSNVKGVASTSMRNVPDVAFAGSGNTEVAVYSGGVREFDSGTAVGASYWAGYLALIDQARANAGKGPVTNVAANLYAAAKVKKTNPFFMISQGCNGYYCAGKNEYNNVTGLGTPDVAKVAAYLESLP